MPDLFGPELSLNTEHSNDSDHSKDKQQVSGGEPRSTSSRAGVLDQVFLSLSLSGIVNEKLLSDYLHHVFPSTKQGPALASLR